MTTRMAKTAKKPKVKRNPNLAVGFGIVRNEDLATFGTREMDVYATEVNLSRAVPDLIDGLKPVQRRLAWSSFQLGRELVKTAKLVGDCMGSYHPHGDASISGAVTVMVNANQPLLRGRGNFGSLIDPAAAMRYTNVALSDYGRTFFDPNYIHKEVTAFVPNYDDTAVEPVSLPALAPNVLMTGAEGIGVGTTTCLPSFTAQSLINICIRMLKGEKLQAIDFAKSLKASNRWGGTVVNTKANRIAWMEMFKSPQARVMFQARLDIDKDNKTIEIDDWPLGLEPVKLIEKIRLLKEVDHAFNSSGATRIRIEMRRDHNYAQFDKLVEKVQKLTMKPRSFKLNVTHRTPSITDGVVTFKTEYLKLSVPQLIVTWLKERLQLEMRSLAYRTKKISEAIAYSELLIFVSKNADAMIKLIRGSMKPKEDLMKRFKLPEFQAQQVLDLPLKRLSKLDQTDIGAKLKEQRLHLKQLQAWTAKPKLKIAADMQVVLDAIESDRKFEEAKKRKMKVA